MSRSRGSISANLNAFLDTTAWSEGTSTHPLTKDDGYDVIVTGVDGLEIFTDYSQHPFANGRPPKKINNKGLFSTASGRYQHMRIHWAHYREQLRLPDFSPISQDKWAIQLIRERKALPLIEMGYFVDAIDLCANLWASFPGAGYGQREHKVDALIQQYIKYGGTLWDSKPSLPQQLPPSLQLPEPFSLENGKVKSEPNPMQPLNTTTQKPNGFLELIKKLLKRN